MRVAIFKIFNKDSKEFPAPLTEYLHTLLTEFGEALLGLLHGFLLSQADLGVKLVGKANYLLLNGLRLHIPVGHGQVTLQNLLEREPGTGMPLGHKSMTRQAITPEQVCTQVTMAQIVVFAKTVYLISICKKNSYIMKHGCLLCELNIKVEFRMCGSHLESLIGNKAAVQNKQIPERWIIRVIFINYPHPHGIFPFGHLTGTMTKLYE